MRGEQHYRGDVATIPVDASARQIAERMRAEAVGSLVVTDGEKPVGMVTDRDLLCRLIAVGRDADGMTARQLMTAPLVSVDPGTPLERVAQTMGAHGIRRIPVVRDERLHGIVSLDDLAASLGDELGDLAAGARRGFRSAQRSARSRQIAREAEAKLRELGEQLERLGGEAGQGLLRQLEALRDRIGGRGA